jgi:hypothetical protein
VQFIEMSDLVSLTALYPTSVSWWYAIRNR